MAARLSDISAHIENVRQLEAVVTALRGISAARTQQSRALLSGIQSHAAIVARAIGEALRLVPRDWDMPVGGTGGRKALILFTAEGGFCGGLSDRVFDAAGGEMADCTLFQIGSRGLVIAEERGIILDWTAPMATQIGAVANVAGKIASALYARIADGEFLRAEMIYPRPQPLGNPVIERQFILPLDITTFRLTDEAQPPLTNLTATELLGQLAEEYIYARLCSAAMHSFVAENEARMAAMTAARDHIDDTLAALVVREHQARQEQVTAEIVELSAATLSEPEPF